MAINHAWHCDNCDETSEYEMELCPCCKHGHIYTEGEYFYCCKECVQCEKCKKISDGILDNCPFCGSLIE